MKLDDKYMMKYKKVEIPEQKFKSLCQIFNIKEENNELALRELKGCFLKIEQILDGRAIFPQIEIKWKRTERGAFFKKHLYNSWQKYFKYAIIVL